MCTSCMMVICVLIKITQSKTLSKTLGQNLFLLKYLLEDIKIILTENNSYNLQFAHKQRHTYTHWHMCLNFVWGFRKSPNRCVTVGVISHHLFSMMVVHSGHQWHFFYSSLKQSVFSLQNMNIGMLESVTFRCRCTTSVCQWVLLGLKCTRMSYLDNIFLTFSVKPATWLESMPFHLSYFLSLVGVAHSFLCIFADWWRFNWNNCIHTYTCIYSCSFFS